MTSAVAVVVGAMISGALGVLVVFFQQRLARHHELAVARVARLSEFSAAAWAVTLAITELAHAPLDSKTDIQDTERFQKLTDRFNSVLAQIQLLDNGEVYASAHRVDKSLVALARAARSAEFDRDNWRVQRAGLSKAVADYQRAARRAVGSDALTDDEPWLLRAQDEIPSLAAAAQHGSTATRPHNRSPT